MMRYIVTEYKSMGNGKMRLCINDDCSMPVYAGEVKGLSLAEGRELSEELYQHILHEIVGRRAVKRAMHLLQRQERTERKLKEKLMQSGYPSEAIEDAVSYVKKYRYLDDERYARNYIQFHQEACSRMRLETDLVRRGVPRQLAQRCLEEEFSSDEREKIRALLEKKHFSAEEADRREAARMYRFLAYRGFRACDIAAVMRCGDFDC